MLWVYIDSGRKHQFNITFDTIFISIWTNFILPEISLVVEGKPCVQKEGTTINQTNDRVCQTTDDYRMQERLALTL